MRRHKKMEALIYGRYHPKEKRESNLGPCGGPGSLSEQVCIQRKKKAAEVLMKKNTRDKRR
jgi:hypothetical protein